MMRKGDAPLPPPGREPGPEQPAISWERASDLFAAALEIPVSKRLDWLAGLSEIDETLRLEVASLLEANERARDFLIPEENEGGSK
jgi:hypothetical protein